MPPPNSQAKRILAVEGTAKADAMSDTSNLPASTSATAAFKLLSTLEGISSKTNLRPPRAAKVAAKLRLTSRDACDLTSMSEGEKRNPADTLSKEELQGALEELLNDGGDEDEDFEVGAALDEEDVDLTSEESAGKGIVVGKPKRNANVEQLLLKQHQVPVHPR